MFMMDVIDFFPSCKAGRQNSPSVAALAPPPFTPPFLKLIVPTSHNVSSSLINLVSEGLDWSKKRKTKTTFHQLFYLNSPRCTY